MGNNYIHSLLSFNLILVNCEQPIIAKKLAYCNFQNVNSIQCIAYSYLVDALTHKLNMCLFPSLPFADISAF